MSLLEAAARARHDLGKYVAFQVRWTGADGPLDELRAALVADLRETHRGPDGTEAAAVIWRSLRPALVEAGVDAIDARVAELEARAERLEAMDEAELRRTAILAMELADALKELYLRIRG